MSNLCKEEGVAVTELLEQKVWVSGTCVYTHM